MKELTLFTLTVLLIASCTGKDLQGKYYLIKSNGREGDMGGQINEISFDGDTCSYEYFSIEFKGHVRREGKILNLEIGDEPGTLTMKIADYMTLEGEGFIGGTFKREDYYRATNRSILGYYHATRPIYMRAGAGNRYAILRTINKGEKVNNIKIFENGWSQVEYGDIRGFAQTKYLQKE